MFLAELPREFNFIAPLNVSWKIEKGKFDYARVILRASYCLDNAIMEAITTSERRGGGFNKSYEIVINF